MYHHKINVTDEIPEIKHQVTLELKSTNTLSVIEDIRHYFEVALLCSVTTSDIYSEWTRSFIIAHLENKLENLVEQGSIDNGQVIFDSRNNTNKEMFSGLFHVEIHFRQKNCLNTTKMLYTIQSP